MYQSCSRVGTAICPCCCSLPVLARAARAKQLAEAEEANKKSEEDALKGGAVVEMNDITLTTAPAVDAAASSASLPATIQPQPQPQSLPPYVVPVPKQAVPLQRSPSWSSVMHSQAAGAIPLVQRLSGPGAPRPASAQVILPADRFNQIQLVPPKHEPITVTVNSPSRPHKELATFDSSISDTFLAASFFKQHVNMVHSALLCALLSNSCRCPAP
jgi:hypothetical protein